MAYSTGSLALAMIRDIVTIAVHAGTSTVRAVVEIQKVWFMQVVFLRKSLEPAGLRAVVCPPESSQYSGAGIGFFVLIGFEGRFRIWVSMF